MKVKILGANGLHASEIKAISKMENKFPDSWFAYAGLLVIDDQGSMDVDTLIITHDRLLLVELKEWNGILEYIDGQWYINRSSRGKSPYAIKRTHAIRLAKLLEKELKHKLGYYPVVEAHIVLCGNATPDLLSTGEKIFVHKLDDFLKLEHKYQDIVSKNEAPKKLFIDQGKSRPNSKGCLPVIQSFFEGPRIKPKELKIHHFIAERDPWFVHRKKLYKEFKGTHEESSHEVALMRRWDFTQLGTGFATQDQWADIALRESRIIGFVRNRNNRLDEYLLQPKITLGKDDITEDVTELYEIRRTYSRLDDFINKECTRISLEERFNLIRALLVPFAELHTLNIGHRDIDRHNLWYANDQKSIIVSGFSTAFFPEKGTIKDLRDQLQSSYIDLPEEIFKSDGDILDPYRQDVFMLAVIAYTLYFNGQYLDKEDNIPIWKEPNIENFNGKLNNWFSKALSWPPEDRFANASEMLVKFNEITAVDSSRNQEDENNLIFDEIMAGDFVKRGWSIFQIFTSYTPIPGENPPPGERISYRAINNNQKAYVKIWQSIRVDKNNPGQNRRILRFRQQLEKFIQGNYPAPAIIDFGILESGGLFLVTRYEEGQNWIEAISIINNDIDKLSLAICLVNTLIELHNQGIVHGDIHPQNLIVQQIKNDLEKKSKTNIIFKIILLDMFDYGEKTVPFNLEFGPPNPAATDTEGRDRYAVYKLVKDLLDGTDYPAVSEELIRGCGTVDSPRVPVSLNPLQDALYTTLLPKPSEDTLSVIPLLIFWNRNALPESIFELEPDGKFYYINYQWDRRNPEWLRCYLTALNASLTIIINPEKRDIVDITFKKNIPLSDVVQASRKLGGDKFTKKILVQKREPESSSIRAIMDMLMGLDGLLTLLEDKYAVYNELAAEELIQSESVRAKDIWQAFAETETESLLTIEVGDNEIEEDLSGRILVPYINNLGQTFDFDPDDRILIKKEDEDQILGDLDILGTTVDKLAIIPKRIKLTNILKKGNILQLDSLRNKASRDRRRKALTRVLDGSAIIQKLKDYFDKETAPALIQINTEPSNEQIARYNKGTTKLNPKQIEAFRQLVTWGPIGVLQGPPGTGKTSFISFFIHYLFQDIGARNVLLVGQSHVAVDNVAKKVREVCKSHSTEISVVRIGNENMIATELLDAHTRALQRKIRHRFHREYDQRVNAFASRIALPEVFVKEVASIHRTISPLLESLRKCSNDIEKIQIKSVITDSDKESLNLLQVEFEKYIDKIKNIFFNLFPSTSYSLPSTDSILEYFVDLLAHQHNVINKLAISKLLNLLQLSHEWLDVLKTGEANYDQFLVKTRQLICGTLVGLGEKQLGINEIVFDWVIVDEAARAQASELMIAIQSGKRIVLVGDHRQLPPYYDRNHSRAAAKRLGVSQKVIKYTDFQRLFLTTNGITLDTQYRMCEHIGNIVSNCFYKDELDELKTGRDPSPDWYSNLPSPWDTAVTWIDSGIDKEKTGQEPVGKGFKNQYEVKLILDSLYLLTQQPHLHKVIESRSDDQPYVIGIITMYRAQKDLLEQQLSRAEWAGPLRTLIKINTVDSYQGQENRIIILSLVRDAIDKHQGFLIDESRINVSISRAQERLIIIGARHMWDSSNKYSALGKVLSYIEKQIQNNKEGYKILSGEFLSKRKI